MNHFDVEKNDLKIDATTIFKKCIFDLLKVDFHQNFHNS